MTSTNQPTILVLMSTYNGEKYITEQIESILNQRDVEVSLLIRDDGSNDQTVEIIERYSKKVNIDYYKGENIRAAQSFMDLIYCCPYDKDLYAFSDQDDIWVEDKLRTSWEALKHEKQPALFYSGIQRINEYGGNVGKPSVCNVEKAKSLQSIIETFATTQGCTMVFNQALLRCMKKCHGKVDMHDSFANALCVAIGGHIICNSTPLVKYRIHQGQVTGKETYQLKRKMERFLNPQKLRVETVRLIDECEDIWVDNKEKLKVLRNYEKLRNKIGILLWKKPPYISWKDHCLFKVRVLFNKY